jgi:hypothetical protein
MLGTNTGPLPGGPPTGGSLDLPGADFFTYDPDADKVSSVVGYFDTATMLGQLGLQAHISPADIEGVMRFGISNRVETGRDAIPGAFTVTWIEIDGEQQMPLIGAATGVVMEQLGNEHYLGTCFATVGRRNYTFSAWTSPEAAQEALRGEAHAGAISRKPVVWATTSAASRACGPRRSSTACSAPAPPPPTSPSSEANGSELRIFLAGATGVLAAMRAVAVGRIVAHHGGARSPRRESRRPAWRSRSVFSQWWGEHLHPRFS